MSGCGSSLFNSITTLAAAAYNFGPFLFASIFLIIISRWSQTKYQTVASRVTPPAAADEKNVYKWTFVGTSVVAVMLTTCSITYWIYGQTRVSAFEFHIIGLNQQQHVWFDGDRYYARTSGRTEGAANFVDVYFALLRNKILTPGEKFVLKYAEKPPAPLSEGGTNVTENPAVPNPFEVEVLYNGVTDITYAVKIDDSGKPQLVERK